MTTSNISKKIKALLNKTIENGCSESEALASANKAQELLSKHNLSMSEVEYSASTFETLVIDSGKSKRDYMFRLISSISKFTDCHVHYSHGGRNSLKYLFFGEKSSTEVANFLFDMLKGAIEYETNNYKKSTDYKNSSNYYSTRTLLNSFRTGMAIRLSQRLIEIKTTRESNSRKENSIQLYDRMAIVKHKFDELNSDIRFGKSSNYKTSISTDAFGKGKEKANGVSITTGLKKGDKETLRLS